MRQPLDEFGTLIARRAETQAEFKAQREAIDGLQGRMVRLEQRMTHLEALFKGQRVAVEIPGSG